MVISGKKLAQLANKWRKMTGLGRKRLTSSVTPARVTEGPCSTSTVTGKGCCAVYTAEGARFEVPLVFLGTAVFGELLRMSEEEFGFAGEDGRITLPCDAAVMEYAMRLLWRNASAEMEAAFLSSIAMPCHCDVAPHLGVSQHFAICSSYLTSALHLFT